MWCQRDNDEWTGLGLVGGVLAWWFTIVELKMKRQGRFDGQAKAYGPKPQPSTGLIFGNWALTWGLEVAVYASQRWANPA